MADITFTNIDENLRDRAFRVIEENGLTPSKAFKLFLEKIAELKTVPFSEENEVPNEFTQKALLEGEEDFKAGKLKIYGNTDEMMQDILALVNHDE